MLLEDHYITIIIIIITLCYYICTLYSLCTVSLMLLLIIIQLMIKLIIILEDHVGRRHHGWQLEAERLAAAGAYINNQINQYSSLSLYIYIYMYNRYKHYVIVCMFVCMYVCMHVCIYVSTYLCIYVPLRTSASPPARQCDSTARCQGLPANPSMWC